MRSPQLIGLILSVALVLVSSKVQAQPIIETVAGGGPNNLLALSSNLSGPVAVAADGNGDLYIASRFAHRIFKVDITGVLTVRAGTGVPAFSGDGGTAAGASLNSPGDVALDAAGNIFIADTLNDRIRRVDALSGFISTVAGTGANGFSGDGGPATRASLAHPGGLDLDAAGNLFIADTGNHRIRRVDAATGIISTVAGDGTDGLSGDGGLAVAASLNNPNAAALDATGNLFIADVGNNRIRRVDVATGIISTVAGNGDRGFGGDDGPAIDASLGFPDGMAFDIAGNLFIAELLNNRIRRVDGATGVISTVAGNGASGVGGDGGLATSANLWRPQGVAFDFTGNMFIADHVNQRIRRVNAATGIIATVAGNRSFGYSGYSVPATDASIFVPRGVAIDAGGNLFIADSGNRRVRRVDAATGIILAVAGNGSGSITSGDGDFGPALYASLRSPTGVTLFADDRLLFIADRADHRIRRVDNDSGIITTAAGNGFPGFSGDGGLSTSASLNSPWGIAFDAAGNLFIADSENHRIRRVDSLTGIISTVAGNGVSSFGGDGGPATSANLNFPTGVAIDPAGDIFIADRDNHRIRRVDSTTGMISTVVGRSIAGSGGDCGPASRARLDQPWAVAFDDAGNLFIADLGNQRIRRVSAVTGVISTVAGNGVFDFTGDGGPATSASLADPVGVALDASGNLFIADSGSRRIRRVLLEGQTDVTDSLFSLRRCSGTPLGRSRRTRQGALSR